MAPAIRPHSSSQGARLDRLRAQADFAASAFDFAAAVESCCAESEADLAQAKAALDAEGMAWIVLCDRGWPVEVRPDVSMLAAAREWMAAWGEFAALPLPPSGSPDEPRHRDLRLALFWCELTLWPALPRAVWDVVGPLNPTGQSTLAYLLQQLAVWLEANALALAAAQRTVSARERFERLRMDALSLGLTPPADSLDLLQWRALVTVVRETVVQQPPVE
ncbi:MAG: hypothetical protein U5K74_01990 [Gemmatimonadaceae bacterium]|nr:hypothetical protein [Gemmatimonadaceae bacterium]